MKRHQGRKLSIKKIVGLSIVVFFLLFSIISMIVVIVIYNGQFPRYDRHDLTVTTGLIYDEFEGQYPRKLVSFKSGKNRLQGYVYGQDQDQGLVVVAHGIGGGADTYLAQITYFVDQGWRVFAYDATGSFDSEGKTTKGFPQALIDLDAALAFINTQEDFAKLPILLFGHSWGGYAVANILHYDYDIASVATVSGANSPMEMIIEQGQRMMGGFIYTQYPYLWLYQSLLFGKTASLNAVDAINGSDVPVFIIHGTEDDFVDYAGSSIISNINTITNPNVRSLSLTEPGSNGHNDLFRSDAAMAYIDKLNIDYRKLYDQYEQNIPYEIKQNFYSQVDRFLAQDINRELMDEIHAFFMESLDE
ncbi:MAG: alpha/beta hydrolase [Thermotogota bacterium]